MSASRHAEYIRKLPPDWEVVQIEELGTIISGGTPSRNVPQYWGDYLNWVVPSELTKLRRKILSDTNEKVSEAGLRNSNARKLPIGSLLITSRATIGYVAVAGIEVCTNQGFKSIAPNDTTNSDFYYHLLGYIAAEFSRLASGSTFLEISRRDFAAIQVPRPPLPEQRCVAEILDTVDDAIAQTDALIAKLRQMKAGLMHDLLTRGLDERGELRDPVAHPEQFKGSPVGKMPREWEVASLGQCAFVTKLAGFEYTNYFDYAVKGEVIAIRVLNIKDGYLDLNDTRTIPRSVSEELPRSVLRKGDLVISYVGTVGEVALIEEDSRFHLAPNVAKISPNTAKFSPEFLLLQLLTPSARKRMFELSTLTSQPALSMNHLRLLPVALPPIPEQIQIAKIGSAHDARLRAEEAYRAKLQQVKQGLMADLLTGKVRV